MSDYKDIFRTKESQIFCKAWTAVHITRGGLVDFVDKKFKTVHNNILPAGFNCLLCTTDCVLESNKSSPCPEHGRIRDAIHRAHRFSKPIPKYRGPSWNNSTSENWANSSCHWEIAKCFMPATGYLTKATAAETDFNGIIGAVINCKHFWNVFTADLSKDNNICTEVRNKVNEIRHFKNIEPGITDAYLNDSIDLFIDLLNDTTSLQGDLKATDARDKLNKLKLDTLVITTEEAGKILEDALTEIKTFHTTLDSTKRNALKEMNDKLNDAHKHLAKIREEQKKKIEAVGFQAVKLIENKTRKADEELCDLHSKIGDEIKKKKEDVKSTLTKVGTEQLQRIQEGTASALEDVSVQTKKVGRKAVSGLKIKISKEVGAAKKELEAKKDRLVTDMRTQGNKTLDASYKQRKYELQQALAYQYRTEQNSMPLSPLLPEIDCKLTKFYMALKMNKVDTKSSTESEQIRYSVDTYKSLFYDGNDPHRNIYIQGEAGIGKTTFCIKLGLIWSENHRLECYKGEQKSTVKQKKIQVFSDEHIMNEFDFVFLLALRHVDGECEIENMIETQIISGLPDHTKYAGIVPKILDKERCLIILDGLDEWSHQRKVCTKSGLVPHRKAWSNTAVVTSTRPWKMNEVRLRDSEISILIHVEGVTDTRTFTDNVLSCLNDKYNTSLDVRNFITEMQRKKLEHFLEIPVVAMQLLWLWHSGHEFGDSKCKMYMNMLDILFGRAQDKSPSACDDVADNPKAELPLCFGNTMFCKQHKMLLDCLGSLACHTLHSCKREESLVFSESIVERHLKAIALKTTDAESHGKSTSTLKTALITGILSQHKSPSRIARLSHFSFLHKTFQEFLAAYYIATHVDESENIVHTLFQVYGQTVDIMNISELFIFVCGLNTEISSKISESVMKSFNVKLADHIEQHVSGGDYNVMYMTESLQKMILAGYKESVSNGHQDPQLALHHVYYAKYVSCDDKIYRDRMVDRNIDKIVTLCAVEGTLDVVKIQQILRESKSTLSHICLVGVTGLTHACIDLFTNITLKSLYLERIYTHFDVKLNTSSLLYCDTGRITKEVEHSVLSALTAAPQLHTLDFGYCKNMSVMCQVLHTLPKLRRLDVHDWKIPALLCQPVSTLSKLQRLDVYGDCEDPSLLCHTLSRLSNLQYLVLCNTNLGDNDILLPKSIQQIELSNVKLTFRSWIRLVDRLTQIPHQVTCTLDWFTGIPVEERGAIVKHIQQYDTFEIQENNRRYLEFTKI